MSKHYASSTHEDFLRKKRNKKLLRVTLVFIVFILFVSLVAYIAHRPSLRISKIELVGATLVSENDISNESLSFLSGSYFWLFPKNNFLLFPRVSLENYLHEKFRRVDTIHIERKGADMLVITITEKKLQALWCENPDSDTCYFMDSKGVIFAEAPSFSGDAYLKYYGQISTSTPIGAQYFASTTQFVAISDFADAVKNLSLKPVSVLASEEGDFALVLSSGGKIYFDTIVSLSKTVQNLQALVKTDAVAKNLARLDYIDLRFGNKLYYKLKTQ